MVGLGVVGGSGGALNDAVEGVEVREAEDEGDVEDFGGEAVADYCYVCFLGRRRHGDGGGGGGAGDGGGCGCEIGTCASEVCWEDALIKEFPSFAEEVWGMKGNVLAHGYRK